MRIILLLFFVSFIDCVGGKLLFLHLGIPKSGSSSVQVGLVTNARHLDEIGVEWPRDKYSQLLQPKFLSAQLSFDKALFRKAAFQLGNSNAAEVHASVNATAPLVFLQALHSISKDAEAAVISSEMLYSIGRRRALLFVQLARDAGFTPIGIVVVRDSLSYIYSMWTQLSKSSWKTPDWHEYFLGQVELHHQYSRNRDTIRDLNYTVPMLSGEVARDAVEMWADILKGKLHVMSFEGLLAQHRDVLREVLCRVILTELELRHECDNFEEWFKHVPLINARARDGPRELMPFLRREAAVQGCQWPPLDEFSQPRFLHSYIATKLEPRFGKLTVKCRNETVYPELRMEMEPKYWPTNAKYHFFSDENLFPPIERCYMIIDQSARDIIDAVLHRVC